ncbi:PLASMODESMATA CALLOSE-BINDING PROTEIN 3-like [Canna indica]|uniref:PLASMODESMATA CALLOSE-BINDING PROTEIN 3-like n=1 Tax=Canna indica TaxID=4628 RepID=A0AAQ3K0N5_9LILI|nr:PLASMODESMATA CALLOSE-BINDING PROTEIN 3-like [Canna indica]
MSMASLAFAVLMLTMFGASEAAWCICKQGLSDSALQKALDYACGAGADCTPILQNGACYSPNTVRDHCSYAVNSYYQRKGQTQDACDFSGTATTTTQDPSYSGCTFPATSSAAGTGSSRGTNTSSPGTFTPNTGGFGSLGPTSSISTELGHGIHLKAGMGYLLLTVISSGTVLLG